jgi:hypothetical protein
VLFFKKSPRFELSPEFYKELGDSLIENLTAKAKRDVMGSVVQNPAQATEMLETIQQSARTLISTLHMSPVQSPALGGRIAQTRDLVAAARILVAVRAGHFLLVWNKPTRRETETILHGISGPRLGEGRGSVPARG